MNSSSVYEKEMKGKFHLLVVTFRLFGGGRRGLLNENGEWNRSNGLIYSPREKRIRNSTRILGSARGRFMAIVLLARALSSSRS